MTHSTSGVFTITVALDVGDRRTRFCAGDVDRKVIGSGVFPTTPDDLLKALRPYAGAKVILEAGSQSPWMSRVLRANGFQVQVVDARRLKLISEDHRKSDRRDAEMLMRIGSAIPEVLGNVHHRGEQAQAHLSIVRARDLVVRLRTQAVQQVRGICKAFGVRLPSSSTSAFPKRVVGMIPQQLHPAVMPILTAIGWLTAQERAFDKMLAKVAKEHYPEVQHLQQVDGIGPVISVAYVLTLENPSRFTNSRRVGSWLGLCPRSKASGESNPQLRISKSGDKRLRRLLVQGAQRVLGRFGADCDLRRYGLQIAARGGKTAKKRAVVAVARKLGVLLHHLWVTGKDYEPLHNVNRKELATPTATTS